LGWAARNRNNYQPCQSETKRGQNSQFCVNAMPMVNQDKFANTVQV